MLVYFLNHSSAPDHLGGAERSLLGLVAEWKASDPDFEPLFLTREPHGKFIDALEERGWPYRSFRFRWWVLPAAAPSTVHLGYFAREDYAATSRMVALMQERRPDLVVTNTIISPWAAFAANSLGIPHVWFVREYGDLDHGLHFQFGRDNTLSDIGMLSELVFSNSLAMKEHLRQYLPVEKIEVVYPAIATATIRAHSLLEPEVEPFGQKDPGLKITVVGRLTTVKGQWRVVEALGKLRDRGVTASVCFVGARVEAQHDSELQKRAQELGVADHVVFAGERENPFPYVRAADVCITPSGHEAFGRTTLEYMILGKPVIATRAGGSTELIDPGTNGYLFEPDDIEGLTDHLARYADTPELVAKHGAAAIKKAAEVQAPEHGAAAAIELMSKLPPVPHNRLPNVARFWFDLPSLALSGAPSGTLTLSYVLNRLVSMTKTFVRHPITSTRRRLQSARR